LAEIEPLEALDVFGMMKEASYKLLEEIFTDRKVYVTYFLQLMILKWIMI